MLTAPSNVTAAFGNPTPNHPVKGPMFTQPLRGLSGHQKFHWRGDRTQLEDFNPAFENLLGGQSLDPNDMSGFAAFMKSIEYPPNPFLGRDRVPHDPRAIAGHDSFVAIGCVGCHQTTHDGAGLATIPAGRRAPVGLFARSGDAASRPAQKGSSHMPAGLFTTHARHRAFDSPDVS